MTFISYAQNLEDVLLWRALGHVQNGFYIDVGANDPVEHSVTRALYDRGWRGINIEPLPALHRRFQEQRPRDINLGIAAGAQEGELTLYDVPAVNGWASPDAAVAAAHRAEGYQVAELSVPVRTLESVWAEHVQGDVHFLKIDVEGFEEQVLRGIDLGRRRPWVLVVEATVPGSRVTNHETWEMLVTPHGYRFAWFDGLNRYYVAEEHSELLAAFTVQPNVFDDYISYWLDDARRSAKHAIEAHGAALAAHRHASEAHEQAVAAHAEAARAYHAALGELEETREHVGALGGKLQDIESTLAATERQMAEQTALAKKLEKELALTQKWGKELERELESVLTSRSWVITEPLRAYNAGQLWPWVKLNANHQMRRFVTWLVSRQVLRRAIIPLLSKLPWLNRQVVGAVQRIKRPDPPAPSKAREAVIEPHLRDLPASARRVFVDLARLPGRAAPEPYSESASESIAGPAGEPASASLSTSSES